LKIMHEHRLAFFADFFLKLQFRLFLSSFVSLATMLACAAAANSQVQSSPSTTWTVTIVLPTRVVAGQPATLAVLGVDGRLASGITVDLGNGQHVTTGETGRAFFTAPAAGSVLVARASGSSAASLIDPPVAAKPQPAVSVSPVVSLRRPFSICGAGFHGDADASHVRINGEPALVLAASPECLSVLPGTKTNTGPAQISIISAVTPGGQWSAQTTLVSLESQFPGVAIVPGKKTQLMVRVHGSEEKLRIVVENQTPGVLRFLRGDVQQLITTGGPQNFAELDAEPIRSGDFSFDAGLLPMPNENAARQYLEAALPLAPKNAQRDISKIAKQIARHPRDLDVVRRGLDEILTATTAGDLHTLLAAARTSL
jgi:hypothetical protein